MVSTEAQRRMTYLKDYQPSAFLIDRVQLYIDLDPSQTTVLSRLWIRRHPDRPAHQSPALKLDGEALKLELVEIEQWDCHSAIDQRLEGGSLLDARNYTQDETSLTLHQVPDQPFVLKTQVRIAPDQNTKLSGLYRSKGNFCTQCESRGFRRITYFIDRPDILSYFETTIVADRKLYPRLLSNGHQVEEGEGEDGRHWVRWVDPSLKPCYLFALVAGQYDCLEDHFITADNRKVALQVYVEPGHLPKAGHAMRSLKDAMLWDEKVYGRLYDLACYMIVAVSDFNFGAMENKGLNIFNSQYILAEPKTATDQDYIAVASVIAHEYFHNWSGNRVICRDWFQITLKEGLTVFRDQSFTADQTHPVVQRIGDVDTIRNLQFAQDSGPMAHPIQPQSYIEVNNFYTVTVYEKGAEVIRMLHTILGKERFHAAMDLYFERHDGEAVTTEHFLQAMEAHSPIDLTTFRRWYDQAGTPRVNVKGVYDAKAKTYTLKLQQTCAETADASPKQPFFIPISMGLLGEKGQPLTLSGLDEHPDVIQPQDDPHNCIVLLKETQQAISFKAINAPPVPSLLRHFSAPVICDYDYSEDELLLLMAHDTDGLNRWQASQTLWTRYSFAALDAIQKEETFQIPDAFLAVLETLLRDPRLDPDYLSEFLILPSERYLRTVVRPGTDIMQLYNVRRNLQKALALHFKTLLLEIYTRAHGCSKKTANAAFDYKAVGTRRLKNSCLYYLLRCDDKEGEVLAYKQFETAQNMTDQMAALTALNDCDVPLREKAMGTFYETWQMEDLVVNKWFRLQAGTCFHGVDQIKTLMKHPAFNRLNPNRVFSVLGAFSGQNIVGFHGGAGAGYRFLAEQVLGFDADNAMLAAGLVRALIHWKTFDAVRGAHMREALRMVLNAKQRLSSDLYEIVSKSVGS